MKRQLLLASLFLALGCSSDDKAPADDANASGSGGKGGSTAAPTAPKPTVCGGDECVAPEGGDQFGVQTCCTADDLCGLQTPLSPDCLEPDQPGGLDATCPDFTDDASGITMDGCCGVGGVCGAFDTFGYLGCIPSASLSAPEASCEYDPRNTCTNLKEVRCDGPEDCPGDQVCCGVFGGGGFLSSGGYAEVGCFDSCSSSADGGGGSLYEVCHAGASCGGGAAADGGVSLCSQSPYLPPYLSRCYSDNQGPPSEVNASGEIACGDATCGGGEKCCVLDCSDSSCNTADLPAPYCAPAGEACTCVGGLGSADAGSAVDAGAADSGSDASSSDGG